MRANDPSINDISKLFSNYIYTNLIRSLLQRGQGRLIFSDDRRSALLLWGPSIFIGGEFSESFGEKLVSILNASDTPRYINYPDDGWRGYIEAAYPGRLKDVRLNLYRSVGSAAGGIQYADPCIVEITRDLIEKNLPGTENVLSELYSYTDMEDFYRNGFGYALVIDGVVSGYCLSEYTVDNSHGVNIWVDERCRRAGYARKMAGAFLQRCRERNQHAFWVCNADNVPSNKVAAASGFTLESTMHYYEL